MKRILYNRKPLALLLFLFTYGNVFTFNVMLSGCDPSYERIHRRIALENQKQICKESSERVSELLKSKNAYIYLKIPMLGDEYLEYDNKDLEYNLEPDKRKERAIPIYIELNANLLNPRKDEREKYLASSKIKEQIIAENSTITRKSCTFMALGSEYLFSVPAEKGVLSVILYFDYVTDLIYYKEFRSNPGYRGPEEYFDQFMHRGLKTEVNLKPGGIYQIEIKSNPISGISSKSYSAWARVASERMNTVPGFTITLKELPPNTKFAFDGKDDVGKTYEQVKKEFILYDKDAEADK